MRWAMVRPRPAYVAFNTDVVPCALSASAVNAERVGYFQLDGPVDSAQPLSIDADLAAGFEERGEHA